MLAEDGASLSPFVLLADFEALLGWVEVFLQIGFHLLHDRVRLQLTG